ncbi:MAG: hypothetical protein J6Y28_00870 [Acholeplasmatales bacterium]|nr:hypothetical protein [Acholeplasmatales bacterium]
MILTINNEKKEYSKPVKLIEISNPEDCCAKVNGTIRDLNYIVKNDCTIEFLNIVDSPDAVRIYEATLRYLVIMAIYNIYGSANVRINYSVSMALYIDLSNMDISLDEAEVNKIKEEMDRLIKLDLPLNRLSIKKEEAIKIYTKQKMFDKVNILKYRSEDHVNIYECNGFYNYMYMNMMPRTSYVKDYKLFPYYPQMIMQYPRSETKGKIPPFKAEQVKYSKILFKAKNWSKKNGIANVYDLNERVVNENIAEFVNLCEFKHNRTLVRIGDKIEDRKEEIKLVAVSGPSSSGKTTFANKLKVELMSRGFKPIMISLDNYYKDHKDIPVDEFGEIDFETIDALDIERFNKDMISLMSKKETEIPVFNFVKQKRDKYITIKPQEGAIVIIEGIHALNEKMTHLIPRDQKFKIFISPQQQINIDENNPIRITDIRLIRRAVRDHLFRNYNVTQTLDVWPSVRRGEFKWIYDCQEDADYIFNSELAYELCVLKKYALPLFMTVKREDEDFANANRIVKFLKYFVTIDESMVPNNSILREFIGGSCFK